MPPAAPLRDPRTCRVFVSSPFGGLEREREELVSQYFPQLSALCQEHGVQFVAADMRWGITEAASRDHKVIDICLREVDRSDIFLGLFGQRYGWHGTKDEALQRNFQLAQKRYPWLKSVRDRSVTEVEFMHGHLNKPGAMPAAFVFRSKDYDDLRLAETMKSNNTEQGSKFTVESPQAAQLLKQLKERVMKTRPKCLCVHEDYSTPEEAARLLFVAVRKYIKSVLLVNTQAQTQRDLDLACHDAHLASRTSIYIREPGYFKALDQRVQKGGCGHVVIGPAGSGKRALVCNWLETVRKKRTHDLVYHFIGCSKDSASVAALLSRLTGEFERLGRPPTSSLSRQGGQEGEESPDALADKFHKMEVALANAARQRKVVVVVDGLDRLEKLSRTSKTLFWLPVYIPKSVTLVVTCRDDCDDIIRELTEARGYDVTKIRPLTIQERQQLCVDKLKQNSKELSTPQLRSIVQANQTSNPLFLRIVLSELCAFGKFRQLDQKISSLVQAQSVTGLFEQFLARLEGDYIPDGGINLIEQVMCGLALSRKGLSECEIRDMFNVPALTWSPLYFAIKDFLIDYSGLLRLAFHELEEAVSIKYLSSKANKHKHLNAMVDYFDKQRQAWPIHIEMGNALVARVTQELPWLLRLLGDKDRLVQLLLDPTVFGRLFVDEQFELLELWRVTGWSGEQIAQGYLQAVRERGRQLQTQQQHQDLHRVIDVVMLSYLDVLSQFLEVAHFTTAQEQVLLLRLEILEGLGGHISEQHRQWLLSQVRLKLSYLYVDLGRFQEAEALHSVVLDFSLRALQVATEGEKEQATRDLATCYHAIGLLSSKKGDVEKAIDHYRQSLALHEKLASPTELADSMNNLGVMLMKRGEYLQAVDLCTKALQIYEKEYFGHLPPVIAIMTSNLAVCYRSLNRLQESERMYRKALEIAERALGKFHPNVATTLSNLGSLELNRHRYQEARGYFQDALAVHEACLTPDNNTDFFKTRERYVCTLLRLDETEAAISEFDRLYTQARAGDLLSQAWPALWGEVLALLLSRGHADKAASLAAPLLAAGVKHESLYITLSKADSAATVQGARPQEMTVDFALHQCPDSPELLKYQIKEVLIPGGDVTGLLAVLDRSSEALGSDIYHLAMSWCQDNKNSHMELALCRHASDKFPTNLAFATQAAVLLNDSENYDSAREYAMRMLSIKPDDVSVGLFVSDLLLRSGQPIKAKEILQAVLKRCGPDSEEVVQVKQALEVADMMIKRQK